MDRELHELARSVADTLANPDRKQLRFNEIVEVALSHYPEPMEGVTELVKSCDNLEENPLYVKGDPMWKSLRVQYGWMVQR